MKNPVFHVLSCFKSEVSFMPADELKTVKDYRNLLAESMFFHALNQGFLKISRRKDSPYYSCSAATDVVARPVKAYIRTSSCKEKGIIEALKSILTEVARVRLHGFSESEISVARALLMSEIESAYLERDQMQSTSLRDEYLQVLFTRFSYGGLSELPEIEYFSCSMGSTIAGEIGVFGYRPSVLMDMLVGKRAEVGTKLGAYMRTFSGDCSPWDTEAPCSIWVEFRDLLNPFSISAVMISKACLSLFHRP
ncbi:Zinc protease PQQL-like [Camellia lanceoleosa]|uniref:Zinc protease PQQL-like n=1 Tax=Camellia lanceoleosa TaxID=1840588 RepID=A0ACC0FGK2_9ERIC|nr:Zinc protease PQQL-like [Camellia lanceoleosa]